MKKIGWQEPDVYVVYNSFLLDKNIIQYIYRTRAIITRGLYISNPIFESHFFVLENSVYNLYVKLVFKSGL